MKKTLLIIAFLSSFDFISAQRTVSNKSNHVSTVCNVIPLGVSPSAFGASGGNNRQVSYDKNINTVAFIHTFDCDTSLNGNSGYYSYDVSFDAGTTWNINQPPIYGPVASPCSLGSPHPARFPKAMIYNPSGNTIPANAHLPYAGVWNGVPGGKVNGTGHFDLTAPAENYDSLATGNAIHPEDIFITKTGAAWIIGELMNSTFQYQDTLVILKGTWNGSDFVYTYYPVHYVTNNNFGFYDMKIAFNDNGQTGYIAMIANSSGFDVLKTTDGGNTWSCPTNVDIHQALDSALINQFATYQTGWTIDIVIDMNDNLHIITHISEYIGGGWMQVLPYGQHGIFDIYTTDGGNTYYGQLLAHPETFMGIFGAAVVNQITELNRQFASRTWDGSKLFFGFFDTDTLTFGIYDNVNPDLHLIGYDVATNLWTAPLSNLQAVDAGENITAGSDADGTCMLGNGSYYSIDNGGTYSVPVTYLVIGNSGVDTDLPCNNFYINCAAPLGGFTYNGHPLPVPVSHQSTLCLGGDGVVLSTNDLSSGLIVSSNYPNPFTGKTSVDVTLANVSDVNIEIRNVVGQVLLTSTYQNLHAGLNTLTMDATSLARGLYFFTVKAGNNSITNTMTKN